MNSNERVQLARKTLVDLFDLAYHLPAVGPEHGRLLKALATAAHELDVVDVGIHGLRPMHEVQFSDELWKKLDQLSARTPDPHAEEDDGL